MAQQTERLSSSDMSSLLAERGPIHVHVGATIVLEGKPPAVRRAAARTWSDASTLVPRFRQRVTHTPLGLDNPVWADDARFDLRWHVRHTALPKPGIRGAAARAGRAGDVASRSTSPGPLWQFYLVEGLEGRRHAYISKTHHALVDGVSAVDVGTIMLDPNPDGTEMHVPEERWDPDVPSPEMLFVRGRVGADPRGRFAPRARRPERR